VLPEHLQGNGEKNGVQDGLNLDECKWRTGQLRGWRNVISESRVVHLVKEDWKEAGGFFVRALLE